MTTTTDPRDRIIQDLVPTVMVPSHSQLPAMGQFGHRFLIARDGVWLDVMRPQASMMIKIADSVVPLPYGQVAGHAQFPFGRLAAHKKLFKEFLADARKTLPNECAGVLIWDSLDEMLVYQRCESVTSSPGSVKYRPPQLTEHQAVAVDLHSHGTMGAFFSSTDDVDDYGEVKIAGVLGNIDQDTPSTAFRICAMGAFIPVDCPAEVWT